MALEEKKHTRILNLGCGARPVKGATNHDLIKHHDYVDITHDLNVLPWPWNDGEFDKIVSHSVFEHLDIDLVKAMNECWRILEPGGMITIKLPYWNSATTWADPTHRRGYALKVFDHFDPSTMYGKEYSYYTPYKWKITRPVRMNKAKTSILVELTKRGGKHGES